MCGLSYKYKNNAEMLKNKKNKRILAQHPKEVKDAQNSSWGFWLKKGRMEQSERHEFGLLDYFQTYLSFGISHTDTQTHTWAHSTVRERKLCVAGTAIRE